MRDKKGGGNMNWLCRTVGHKWTVKLRYKVDGIRFEELRVMDACVRCEAPNPARVQADPFGLEELGGSFSPSGVTTTYGFSPDAAAQSRDERVAMIEEIKALEGTTTPDGYTITEICGDVDDPCFRITVHGYLPSRNRKEGGA